MRSRRGLLQEQRPAARGRGWGRNKGGESGRGGDEREGRDKGAAGLWVGHSWCVCVMGLLAAWWQYWALCLCRCRRCRCEQRLLYTQQNASSCVLQAVLQFVELWHGG